MKTTRYSCNEQQLARMAGTTFDQWTPYQRNQARILAMYFSNPETYHADVVNELKEHAARLDLVVGDEVVNNGTNYRTISALGNAPAPTIKATRDEMIQKLHDATGLSIKGISTWEDDDVETAYINLRLAPRPQRQDKPLVGYLLMDGSCEYVRFKPSTDAPDEVIEQYNDYVTNQQVVNAVP